MISSELYKKVAEVIDNLITVQQLEEWLVPRLPAFLVDPNSSDADIIATIELGLAEMNDGIRTKEEFSKLLRDTIQEQNIILNWSPSSEYYKSGASNQTSQPVLDFAPFPLPDFITTSVAVQL